MSVQHMSSLPAVLKTYNPSYEPSRKVQKEAPKSVKLAPPPPKQSEDVPATSKKHDSPKKRPESSGPFTRPFSRERTVDIKAQEKEKHLKSFRYWELVKQELKEEDTEKLKEKIFLQLSLIKAQELAYQNKVTQEQQEDNKRREEERAVKRAQAEALLAICRKSLAQDRRKKRDAQKRSKSSVTTTAFPARGSDGRSQATGSVSPGKSPTKTPQPVQSIPTKLLLDDSEDELDNMPPLPTGFVIGGGGGGKKEAIEMPSGKSSLASTPQPTSGANTPLLREITTNITREVTRASTLQEEDELDEDEEDEEEDEFAEFPSYQQQLYRLYGRTVADSFLYPKVEAEAKKKSKPIDPRFKNPDGRTGANELWTNLRNESRSKLLKVDRTIKDELKDAFGAFARESMALKRPNVTRNFCNKDDVPDIEHLMDQSVVQGAQDYRHRMELMFRSSHINEDRCKVLLYNNPIPNLNNRQGEDSVSRYMPSWADHQDSDIESERSYKKWLLTQPAHLQDVYGSQDASAEEITESGAPTGRSMKLQASALTAAERTETAEHQTGQKSRHDTARTSQSEQDEALLSLPDEWEDFMMVRRPTGAEEVPKPQKYHFLTEREAKTPGQFRKRQEEARKARNLPRLYQAQDPQEGSQSAAPHVGRSQTLPSTGRSAFAVSTEFTLSSGGPRSLSTQQEIPSWEPLSMEALVEYRERRRTLGVGDYRRGKAPTWHVQQAAIVES